MTTDLTRDRSANQKENIEDNVSLAKIQSQEQDKFKTENRDLMEEEEPITGKNQVEDEILLLNKRLAWKQENEQQLEEVAFGEDMRKSLKDKELFEKLTEIDKKKYDTFKRQYQNYSSTNYTTNSRNGRDNLSNEDKLRMLEKKINVYADE